VLKNKLSHQTQTLDRYSVLLIISQATARSPRADFHGRLPALVASVAVGAVRKQPLHRFCFALPPEVHQQRALSLISRIDVGSACGQQFHQRNRIGLRGVFDRCSNGVKPSSSSASASLQSH
jgi:hypothetical protein